MLLPETIEQQLALLKALADRPLTLPPVFVDIAGSINAGLLLSQIVYWTKKNSEKDPASEGWFFVVLPKFQEQLRMGKHEFESARQKLKAKQFIDWDLRGVPPRVFFWADLRKILVAVNLQLSGNRRINSPQSEQSGKREITPPKPGNQAPETGESIPRKPDSPIKEQETKRQETNQETSQERGFTQPVDSALQKPAPQNLFPPNGSGKRGLSPAERDSWDLRRWRESFAANAPYEGSRANWLRGEELIAYTVQRMKDAALDAGVTIPRLIGILQPFYTTPEDRELLERLDPKPELPFVGAAS